MSDGIIIGLLCMGFLAGFSAGFLGIGGGIIFVPVLAWALKDLGVSQGLVLHMATATSLAAVFFTHTVAVVGYWQRGLVQVELLKFWVPYALVGSYLGSYLNSKSGEGILALGFSLFCLFVAVRLLWVKPLKPLAENVPSGFLGALLPLLIGMVSSMLGIGGNAIGIVILILLGQNIRMAAGTMSAMCIPMSLVGVLGYVYLGSELDGLPQYSLGYVHGVALMLLVPTALVSAPLGVYCTQFLSRQKLQKVFGCFLILVGLKMLQQFWL